ncbi:MAG: hypothetical protein WDK96_00100 [Candidatus Paceibacterota bacterium]|jgi:hypothetical protein
MFNKLEENIKRSERNKKLWKEIYPFILFFLVVFFLYMYQDNKKIITCYEEQANSYIYPESFFVPSDFKEFCSKKGIIIEELDIDYETIPLDYKYEQE